MFKFLSAAPVLALALISSAANAVVYTTDTVVFTGLGDEIGSPFDQVTLGAAGGDYTGNGTYLFNNVSFTVGINSNSNRVVTGTLTGTGNVGYNFTYPVAYSLDINNVDTITLGGNYFVVGGVGLHFNKLILTAGVGETATGQLSAVAGPVPEPATWGLMIAGFGIVGFAARRRSTTVLV